MAKRNSSDSSSGRRGASRNPRKSSGNSSDRPKNQNRRSPGRSSSGDDEQRPRRSGPPRERRESSSFGERRSSGGRKFDGGRSGEGKPFRSGEGKFDKRGGGKFEKRGEGKFEKRSSGGFEKRGDGNFGKRSSEGFEKRDGGRFGDRGESKFGKRDEGKFKSRGGKDFEKRGDGKFDNRGDKKFDSRGERGGFDKRGSGRFGSRSEGGSEKRDGGKFGSRGDKKFEKGSEEKFDRKGGGFGKRSSSGFKRDDSFSDKKAFDKPRGNSFRDSGSDDEKKSGFASKRSSSKFRGADEERGSFKKSKSRFNEKDQVQPDLKAPVQTDKIRLNRYIANSGVCSRREADELITMGLISVNGKTITELGYKVNPGDEVRYENKILKAERPVYILMNKPKGYLTTTDDPQERNTVMHIIGGAVKERIYPVGRLDRNTTGLLLLTNDGDLADKLMHPSHNVKKIYKVDLDRPLTKADFQKIQEGVLLEEGRAAVDDVALVSEDGKTVGVEIHIGWNRVVRRIFETLGYEVVKLDRSVYAGLDKKDLSRGHWRFLTKEEIVRLKHYQ